MPARPQVGILTFHRCINYGSYWQARCLVEGMRALGYNAVLMDHRSPAIDRAEWRCALDPVGMRHAGPHRDAYREKTRRFLAAFDELPMSRPFPLDRPAEAQPFEHVVVGSDEVWNLRHPWYGGHAIFYGEGLGGDLVSYAASFGNQDASGGLPEDWRTRLRAFSSVAVRDDNSRRIVSEARDAAPEIVLDPCLQFPAAIEAAAPAADAPYLAVYGHSFPAWYVAAIRRWADDRSLRVLSIGYHNPWADEQRIDATPQQFAGLIAGSEAVATNFFHGCVFSLVNHKPFVCASSDYRSNKLHDLLALIGEEARLLHPPAVPHEIAALLATSAAAATYDAIRTLRRRSYGYLEHALG